MRALPTEPLLHGADSVLGVARIRGAFVPVVGLSLLMSGTPSVASRMVLLRVNERSVALAVDDVLQVVDLPTDALRSLPELLKDAAHDRVAGIAERDGQLLAVLQTARIVESVSAAVDQRVTPS